MIEVLATGPLATVQDLGRPGYATLGVPRSGAFDRAAAALANRLVGNEPGAALIELTLGGLRVRLHDATTVAVTGAACPGPRDSGVAVTLGAGVEFGFGTPRDGLRTYLGVRGGIDVEPVLGSRATDTLSGLGPARLAAGDRLPIGSAVGGDVSGETASSGRVRYVLRIIPGPRDDWFSPEALRVLTSTAWTVRPECDRIGLRLDGPRLTRAREEELPSEPTLPGALQVPPDGRPILFGPDAPVTGGYPVLAVVRDADLDHAAQLRPGDEIKFSRS
jgi:biotin-dependent carboxylase-like uncharacterized protein